jgi:hypothetical protein
MKRFHVHVQVADLQQSILFYSTMFGEPAVVKPDYAKWMVEDPRLNFAISRRGNASGVDHLGIQVDSDEELAALRTKMANGNLPLSEQADASCCYAKSNKWWTMDPQGLAWETYHTLDSIPTYGEDARATEADSTSACCGEPARETQASCCGSGAKAPQSRTGICGAS